MLAGKLIIIQDNVSLNSISMSHEKGFRITFRQILYSCNKMFTMFWTLMYPLSMTNSDTFVFITHHSRISCIHCCYLLCYLIHRQTMITSLNATKISYSNELIKPFHQVFVFRSCKTKKSCKLLCMGSKH